MLPRDISQQIFNELVDRQCLTDASLGAFRDCALQVMSLSMPCPSTIFVCSLPVLVSP